MVYGFHLFLNASVEKNLNTQNIVQFLNNNQEKHEQMKKCIDLSLGDWIKITQFLFSPITHLSTENARFSTIRVFQNFQNLWEIFNIKDCLKKAKLIKKKWRQKILTRSELPIQPFLSQLMWNWYYLLFSPTAGNRDFGIGCSILNKN